MVNANRVTEIGDVGAGPIVDSRAATVGAIVGHNGAEVAARILVAKAVGEHMPPSIGAIMGVAH